MSPRASSTGPMSFSTTPLIAAGRSGAIAMVISPPREVPTNTASLTPVAAMTCMTSSSSILMS